MNKIYLNFEKSVEALSGNEFGKSVFDNQVKNYIISTDTNSIIFSQNIKLVGVSFIKGMFSDYLGKIDINDFKKLFTFEDNNERLEKKIWSAVYF